MKRLSWLFSRSHWLTKSVRKFPHVARRMRHSPHRHNALGSLVVVVALSFLYFHAQPTTAGTDPVSPNSQQTIAGIGQDFGVESAGNTPAATEAKAATANDTPILTGKEALTESERILAEAEAKLEKIPAYTATFVKQERIGDSLTDLQIIQLRLFHQPKKLFMKWEGGKNAGQRVIYAEGENDGDMLVRMLTGIEARLGVISLNPTGALAMKHSRYPVTKAGLLELTKITRQHRQTDLKAVSGVSAKLLEHQKIDNRDCLCLVIEYAKPEFSPDEKKEYRKSLIYIDSQTKLPICVRCYGWLEKVAGADPKKLDQTTLLELYAYRNIDFEAQVQADDFAKARLQ
ncbi:MAG: DUF1571 domain-containing protein [Planctomycetaceae bacterium]|nr:DUF1571 domain-containing protein [Planctomycetaceae bacterium]